MPLIDSDTWIAKLISLRQLQFHPANPRLPELRGKFSEREIIHELCNRGTIDTLARDMAEKGYFRNDRLIVLRENGKHIVYEGNRRLCALKVLDDPSLAPPKMQKLFKKYSDKAKLPKKVAVEVVPSKFDAEIVMYAKHAASSFVVGWDPIQYSTFIAAKLDSGSTIDELSNECGLKRDDVINARAAVDLYRLSRLATLTSEAQALVDDPAKFPYSTVFERFFKPKKSREALGVKIGEGGLVVESSEDKFFPILARVLDDAAHDNINTRKLGTEGEQIAYVKKLKFTPGGGKFTADEAERQRKTKEVRPSPSIAIASAAQTPKVQTSRANEKFFSKNLTVAYPQPKIAQLIGEGQKLDVASTPHSCAFLLRVLLEISLTTKIKSLKLYPAAVKLAKNPNIGPTLAEMLDYVNRNHVAFNLDASGKIALEALVSRQIKQSKPQLDRIMHNPAVLTHSDEVIAIREQAMPLLLELLK